MTQQPKHLIASSSTPGRICLVGENLDWMNEGPSIVAAIPLRTAVNVWGVMQNDQIILSSGAPAFQKILINPGDPPRNNSLRLMYESARVVMQKFQYKNGISINASSELPIGAGLASSAAISLAVAGAVELFITKTVPKMQRIIESAFHAEVVEIKSGAGWMDFMACAHGGLSYISSKNPPQIEILEQKINTPIILIDTMQPHLTAHVVKESTERFLKYGNVGKEYIKQTSIIVSNVAKEITKTNIDYKILGELLCEAQKCLRDMLNCSTRIIDECLKRVMNSGAFGAKITGSGCGGCIFAIAPVDLVSSILKSISDLPVRSYIFPEIEQNGITYCIKAVSG